MKPHKHIRYSEAFKRQVVEQIQSGKYRSIHHAQRAYGIRGSTDDGWLYLSLTMDRFSRKIVGWNLANNLNASESVKALKMAMKQVPAKRWPIHQFSCSTVRPSKPTMVSLVRVSSITD